MRINRIRTVYDRHTVHIYTMQSTKTICERYTVNKYTNGIRCRTGVIHGAVYHRDIRLVYGSCKSCNGSYTEPFSRDCYKEACLENK